MSVSPFDVPPSMPFCWPWCWPPLLNTFCTVLTCKVRIPGTTRLSTCSTLSSSQVLFLVYWIYTVFSKFKICHWNNFFLHCFLLDNVCVCSLRWNGSKTQILVFTPGFIKVLLYIAFMTIMIKVHTFPLFAIRPMYLAMRWATVYPCLFVWWCFIMLFVTSTTLHFVFASHNSQIILIFLKMHEMEVWSVDILN